MSVSTSPFLRSIDDAGNGWCLKFEKTGDRFAHEIHYLTGGHSLPVLHSLEGQQSDCPFSPPLQQISKECRQTGDVILGVGMAGKNHWSVAFQVGIPNPLSLKIEVACRLNELVEQLTSTYSINQNVKVDHRDGTLDASSMRFNLPDGQIILSVADGGGLAIDPTSRRLSVVSQSFEKIAGRPGPPTKEVLPHLPAKPLPRVAKSSPESKNLTLTDAGRQGRQPNPPRRTSTDLVNPLPLAARSFREHNNFTVSNADDVRPTTISWGYQIEFSADLQTE